MNQSDKSDLSRVTRAPLREVCSISASGNTIVENLRKYFSSQFATISNVRAPYHIFGHGGLADGDTSRNRCMAIR
jgi:hypothetical protein